MVARRAEAAVLGGALLFVSFASGLRLAVALGNDEPGTALDGILRRDVPDALARWSRSPDRKALAGYLQSQMRPGSQRQRSAPYPDERRI